MKHKVFVTGELKGHVILSVHEIKGDRVRIGVRGDKETSWARVGDELEVAFGIAIINPNPRPQ